MVNIYNYAAGDRATCSGVVGVHVRLKCGDCLALSLCSRSTSRQACACARTSMRL